MEHVSKSANCVACLWVSYPSSFMPHMTRVQRRIGDNFRLGVLHYNSLKTSLTVDLFDFWSSVSPILVLKNGTASASGPYPCCFWLRNRPKPSSHEDWARLCSFSLGCDLWPPSTAEAELTCSFSLCESRSWTLINNMQHEAFGGNLLYLQGWHSYISMTFRVGSF